MMSKKLLLGFALLFLAVSVSAASSVNWEEVNCQDLTYEGTPLSSASITLPADVASFLNGETINLEVTLSNGSKKTVSGKVTSGVLSEITCSTRTDATLDAFVTSTVIDQIANASNPIKAFKDAKAAGDIRFQSRSFATGIKLFLADLFLMFQ